MLILIALLTITLSIAKLDYFVKSRFVGIGVGFFLASGLFWPFLVAQEITVFPAHSWPGILLQIAIGNGLQIIAALVIFKLLFSHSRQSWTPQKPKCDSATSSSALNSR